MSAGTLNPLRPLAIPLVALAFVLSPALSLRMDPHGYVGGRSRDELQRVRRNSSAVAIMLGEIRTSLSDILFLKTERYLDSGVAYMPHTQEELDSLTRQTEEMEDHQAEVAGTASGHDHDHDHAEEEKPPEPVMTIIPPPQHDYRGFIGVLEREVKPWRDPALEHHHTDGTELLPWYRVMTLADPHNVRGYAIGAWWLRDHNLDEAIRFVGEGVENNPEDFHLPFVHGRLLYRIAALRADTEGWDDPEVLAQVRQAQESCRSAAELALARRPPEGPSEAEDAPWDLSMEEDALSAARLLILLERRHGDPEEAGRLALRYAERFGGEPSLSRLAD